MATAADRLSGVQIVWVFTYVVIPHPTERRVLLLPEDGGWTLPWWSTKGSEGGIALPDLPEWHETGSIDRALREQFGLHVSTLRCLYAGQDPRYGTSYLYESEPAPLDWTPPTGARWIGHDELEHLSLMVEGHHALLDRWYAEADDAEALARRPAWYHPGWFAEATAWIDAQLTHLGLTATAPPVQMRSRERSAEIYILTTGGRLRFKAVPNVHGHEPALTAFLARTFPGRVPQVVARDDERRWMLYVDVGATRLFHTPDPERWGDALRRYAELQVALIPRVPELRSLGVPCRPIGEVPHQLHVLLKDSKTIWPRRELPETFGRPVETLSRREIERLRTLAPSLASCCAELAGTPTIPDTLDHGTFWAAYATPTEDGYTFSDWSDAAIAHPFFSVAPFLLEAPKVFDDPAIVTRLRGSYLDPWSAFASRDELVRIFTLAQEVAWLQYAVLVYRDLLPAMGAKWEREWVLHYALRLLLHHQREVHLPGGRSPASKPRKERMPSRPNQLPRSMRRLQRIAT